MKTKLAVIIAAATLFGVNLCKGPVITTHIYHVVLVAMRFLGTIMAQSALTAVLRGTIPLILKSTKRK